MAAAASGGSGTPKKLSAAELLKLSFSSGFDRSKKADELLAAGGGGGAAAGGGGGDTPPPSPLQPPPSPQAALEAPAASAAAASSSAGAGAADASAELPADGGARSEQELRAEVLRCKATLEGAESSSEDQLAALTALQKMGNLPTKLLGETLIGKAVNALAKGASDEAVKGRAKDLVEEWRQMHRKRKATTEPGPLKRSLSSSLSLASEAPASQDAGASQPVARSTSAEGLPRTDSLLSSLGEESIDAATAAKEGGIAPYREKVLQKLIEAFGKEEEIEAKDGNVAAEEKMRDPVKLAAEIDEALHAVHASKEPYLAQARSILYNLKDKKNHTFRFKLMVGFYKPQDVPKLSAEDMASDEKNAERAKQRKYAMEEIQSDWALKNGQQRITGMFTCGKCKGTKTTYFQMQTRSSDEPMTTFVTCLTCNNRWKFC